MAHLTGSERTKYVRAMFAHIARRYDLMNWLMTAGQDTAWRRQVIQRAALPAGGKLLDLGTGTGDLVFEALRQQPDCRPLAADLTIEMMQVGRIRHSRRGDVGLIEWCAVDALRLPFSTEQFDAVVSGFLLRNVPDVRQALAEQARVLKPGGWLVALDTTRPRPSLLSPLVRLHLRLVIPLLGRLVTGQPDAYRYLPDSTRGFLSAEQLAACLGEAGLIEVGFQARMFGTVAVHWGKKPNHFIP
jgi:demethylmenaquinone methyltransferase/2-methoxy-6-polyprenyl-1,4-benzoquinol methylase